MGRISAWWTDEAGETWCLLRTVPHGSRPQWLRYDPESVRLLPTEGI
ncbi:hypothetical protein ABTY53_05525 [Streptomyces noursei]